MLATTETKTPEYWYAVADRIAAEIGAAAATHDCDGSFVVGPVVTVEMSSDHEIEDDGEPVVLWEQGQGDW